MPRARNNVSFMTLRRNPDLPSVALVADGDSSFIAFVDHLLERLALGTLAVSTGAAVLQAARQRPPALVVLDVCLPDISGFEICRELRDELGDELPIILVSKEKTDDLDRAAGLLLGADDYLAKPVDPTLLVAVARRLVRRAHATQSAAADPPRAVRFTARELEVLTLL